MTVQLRLHFRKLLRVERRAQDGPTRYLELPSQPIRIDDA